ncbi:amino acid exporter, putative [Porphyromonas crevioricanis JCM 15906]|nr:amino acid exporter, putative [Porphyromonas crevioricanis JCM 15906]
MTGVGAAVSDLVYATLTYLGVGFVVSFVKDNNPIFTLLGSFLMLGFAFYLYRSRASLDILETEEHTSPNYMRTIVSSFFLTFSNPLIILFFIALFTRFNIVPEGLSAFLGYCIVMLGIAIGALSWWYAITHLVSKLRDRISVIGLRWFNRIVAIIFALVSLVGLVSGLIGLLEQ